MLYLIFGEDDFRSRKKLREIIEEYRKKNGADFNLHRFDASENKLNEAQKLLESNPLFGLKKLLVVEEPLSRASDPEFLKKFAKDAHSSSDSVVIFWERGGKENFSKRLQELFPCFDKIQEFKALGPGELAGWLASESRRRNLKLKKENLELLSSCGNNLWALSNELDKFALGAGNSFVKPETDRRLIFSLGDYFFSQKKEALKSLLKILSQGEEEFGVFSYLANHNRNLLLVKSAVENKKDISLLGLHPFVAKKSAYLARNLSAAQLKSGLKNFFEEGFKIKIGLSRPKDSLLRILLEN